jgi:hypothetical protein
MKPLIEANMAQNLSQSLPLASTCPLSAGQFNILIGWDNGISLDLNIRQASLYGSVGQTPLPLARGD